MQSLANTILAIVSRRPGISTTDLAFAIYGRREQPLVNGECLHLVNCGKLVRAPGDAGVLENYISRQSPNISAVQDQE